MVIAVVYSVLASASILILPVHEFTALLPLYKIGIVCAILSSTISITVAALRRLPGTFLFLVGVLVMGVGVGTGLLGHSLTGASAGINVYMSFFFLILAQATILGQRITDAFRVSEELRTSLAAANIELEEKVGERTKLLKQSTHEAHEAKSDAIRANRVKSEFLAMMSHEIRTPLNGVLGMAGLLAQTDLSSEQSSKLEAIRQSGDDLLYLLNDILDYSKIEAGQLDLEARPFDLVALMNRCTRLWQPQAEAKGLNFNC